TRPGATATQRLSFPVEAALAGCTDWLLLQKIAPAAAHTAAASPTMIKAVERVDTFLFSLSHCAHLLERLGSQFLPGDQTILEMDDRVGERNKPGVVGHNQHAPVRIFSDLR